MGLLDYWIIGLLDYWIIGLLDYWIIGLLDYWIIGNYIFQQINEPPFTKTYHQTTINYQPF